MNVNVNKTFESTNLESGSKIGSALLINSANICDSTVTIFRFINFSVLSCAIATFGLVGNIINLIVFNKQGNKSTLNISLTALAFTDLCNILTVLWFGITLNPLISTIPCIIIVPSEFAFLVGYTHSAFVRIKAWIAVFMTAERCLCITFPMKIKQIVTPNRAIATIFVIYAIAVSAAIPEYLAAYIDWKFYPKMNRTLLGIVYFEDRKYLESHSFLMFSVLILSSFPVIVVLTLVLVVKLRQMSVWRAKSLQSQAELLSAKDRMAIRTVAVVSCDYIITLLPAFFFPFLSFIFPDFNVSGKLSSCFIIFGSFTIVFDAINSIINIVLYLLMSNSYRLTFLKIFPGLN